MEGCEGSLFHFLFFLFLFNLLLKIFFKIFKKDFFNHTINQKAHAFNMMHNHLVFLN
jgi:hypothetical protein